MYPYPYSNNFSNQSDKQNVAQCLKTDVHLRRETRQTTFLPEVRVSCMTGVWGVAGGGRGRQRKARTKGYIIRWLYKGGRILKHPGRVFNIIWLVFSIVYSFRRHTRSLSARSGKADVR